MTQPHDLATWPFGTADKAADLAEEVGIPLEPWQREVLHRFEAAPAAPESFVHRPGCEPTPDAPGLCECPPAVLPPPTSRPRIPTHLAGSERPGGGDPLGDYLWLKGEGR